MMTQQPDNRSLNDLTEEFLQGVTPDMLLKFKELLPVRGDVTGIDFREKRVDQSKVFTAFFGAPSKRLRHGYVTVKFDGGSYSVALSEDGQTVELFGEPEHLTERLYNRYWSQDESPSSVLTAYLTDLPNSISEIRLAPGYPIVKLPKEARDQWIDHLLGRDSSPQLSSPEDEVQPLKEVIPYFIDTVEKFYHKVKDSVDDTKKRVEEQFPENTQGQDRLARDRFLDMLDSCLHSLNHLKENLSGTADKWSIEKCVADIKGVIFLDFGQFLATRRPPSSDTFYEILANFTKQARDAHNETFRIILGNCSEEKKRLGYQIVEAWKQNGPSNNLKHHLVFK